MEVTQTVDLIGYIGKLEETNHMAQASLGLVISLAFILLGAALIYGLEKNSHH